MVVSFMKIFGLTNFIFHEIARSNSVGLNIGTWRL